MQKHLGEQSGIELFGNIWEFVLGGLEIHYFFSYMKKQNIQYHFPPNHHTTHKDAPIYTETHTYNKIIKIKKKRNTKFKLVITSRKEAGEEGQHMETSSLSTTCKLQKNVYVKNKDNKLHLHLYSHFQKRSEKIHTLNS